MGLDVNLSKTVYTVFQHKCGGRVRPLSFAGRPIEFERWGALYLGGKLRYDGSLVMHKKHRGRKGERALGATVQIWKRFPRMTLKFQCELAEVLVRTGLLRGRALGMERGTGG